MKCRSPFIVEHKTGVWDSLEMVYVKSIPVPCGHCVECIETRIRQYAVKLHWEFRRSVSAKFVTLTYADKHCPYYYGDDGEIVLHLQKRDIELFLKRLRGHDKRRVSPTFEEGMMAYRRGLKVTPDFRLDREPIRYWVCGEFGGRTKRPHYHLILFNTFEAHIRHAWDLGRVDVQSYSQGSAYYTLKYLETTSERFSDDDDERNERPFHHSSHLLGMNYLFADGVKTRMANWHLEHVLDRCFLTTADGKKCSMPVYWKKLLYCSEDLVRIRQGVHDTMMEKDLQFERFAGSELRAAEMKHVSLMNEQRLFDRARLKRFKV